MASGKQPSRDARKHGEKCRVLFSRPNKPRHRYGTVLQGGNAGNSILSFRNAILTFSFQSYHLAAQSCRLVRHPIIWFLHSIPIICNPILFVTPPRYIDSRTLFPSHIIIIILFICVNISLISLRLTGIETICAALWIRRCCVSSLRPQTQADLGREPK